MRIKVKYSGNIGGKETSFANVMNKKLEELQTAVEETVIETFTRVVKRTPITTGALISNWEVSVGEKSKSKPINYFNADENTTVAWSKQKANDLAQGFESAIRLQIKGSMPTLKYKMVNETPYGADIEFGQYEGHLYKSPWKPYYDYSPPFTLTRAGWSHKATKGMVRVTAIEAGAIFEQKVNKEL